MKVLELMPPITLHRAVGVALGSVIAAVGLLFWTATNNVNMVKTVVAHTLVFAAVALMLIQWRTEKPTSHVGRPEKRRGANRSTSLPPEALRLYWPMGSILAALVAALLLSAAMSPFKYASVEELSRFLCHMALFLLAANWARSLGDILRLVRLLIIVATLAAVYGLMQQVGLDPIGWRNLDRIIGPLGNPNFYSGFLILVLPVQVVELLLASSRGHWWRIPALMATTAATILTFSRAAWLGGAVGMLPLVVGLLLFHRRDLLRPNLPLVAGGLAAILLLAAWFTFPAATSGSARVQLSQVTGSTFRVRLVAWGAAWKMFEDRPLMGQGLGTYQQFFPVYKGPEAYRSRIGDNTLHAHSEWLEALGEMGLVGGGVYMAAFLVFGIISLRAAWRLRREGRLRHHAVLWGLCGGVLAGLAHGALEVTLRWTAVAATVWLLMGLAAAVWRELPEEISEAERRNSAWRRPVIRSAWASAAIVGAIVLFIEGRVLSGDYHLKRGSRLREAGFEQAALDHYLNATRSNPWNLEAIYQMASTQVGLGDPQGALRTYQRLQRFAPDYASIDTNLHLVHRELGQAAEALSALERALSKDRTPRNRLLLASHLFESGQPEEARAELAALEQSDPEDPDVHFLGAGLLNGAGLIAEELALLERGLERFPDDREMRRAAMGACEMLGREDQLMGHIEEHLTRDPVNRRALFRLGDLLESRHRWAEARDLYAHHQQYFAGDLEFVYRLAQASHQCGDWETARPLLEQIAGHPQANELASIARRYLMEMSAASLATTVPLQTADDQSQSVEISDDIPGLPQLPQPPIPEIPLPVLPSLPTGPDEPAGPAPPLSPPVPQ